MTVTPVEPTALGGGGALAQLPDTTRLRRLAEQAAQGCTAGVTAYSALRGGADGPAVAPALTAVGEVRAQATVDVSGLAEAVQAALGRITAAVPPAVRDEADALQRSYVVAREALLSHPLAGLLPEGHALHDVARQVLDEAVVLFERRLTELTASLVPSDDLAELVRVLRLADGLRRSAASPGDLSAYLVVTLLGFSPGVLAPLRLHVADIDAAVGDLEPAALAEVVGAAQAAVGRAGARVDEAVQRFEPTAEAAYEELAVSLDALAEAVRAGAAALRAVYGAVGTRASALRWPDVAEDLLGVLSGVDLRPRSLVDDVLSATTSLLDDLVASARDAVAADELVGRVEAFGAGLHAAVAGSAVGQARAALLAFLEDLRSTVEAVPFPAARAAVSDALSRVGEVVEDLGLDDAAATLEQAFTRLEDRAVEAVTQAGQAVRQQLEQLLDALDAVPTGSLVDTLQQALAAAAGVVDGLTAGAGAVLDDLRTQLAGLEQLSFRPPADVVVGEIDELRVRLRTIEPDALSEEGRLALRAGLAVLQALDVEGEVVDALTREFARLQGGLRDVLDDVAARLGRVRVALDELRPDTLLAPVVQGLHALQGLVDGLDAAALLTPVRAGVANADEWLSALAPGALLDPLRRPHEQALTALSALDPALWGAPLADLHGELAAAADRVDLSPVFAAVDERRRELVEAARLAVAEAVERLELPAPLDAWFARVRGLLEGVTDVLFVDPVAAVRELGDRAQQAYTPSALYEPLTAVVDEVLATLRAVPPDALLAEVTALRDDLVGALDELEPRRLVARLRAAHRRLVDASPRAVLPSPTVVLSWRASVSAELAGTVPLPGGAVGRVDARFDAVLALLDPASAASLATRTEADQQRALAVLSSALDAVDVTPAQEAFTHLRHQVETLVPPPLLRPGPLGLDDVVAAVEHWRPADDAGRLDERLEAFLDELRPVAVRLETAFDTLGSELRATLELLDPLALDRPVGEVLDAVRAQVDALDPALLLDELRTEVYLPVRGALEALDPALLAARLDVAYQHARDAVTAQLTALVTLTQSALHEHLEQVRASVRTAVQDVEAALTTTAQQLTGVVHAAGDLVLVDLVARLQSVLDNLGTSFDAELRRIRAAFDAMLAAAPLAGSPRTDVAPLGATA